MFLLSCMIGFPINAPARQEHLCEVFAATASARQEHLWEVFADTAPARQEHLWEVFAVTAPARQEHLCEVFAATDPILLFFRTLIEKLGLFRFDSKTVYDKQGDLDEDEIRIKIVFSQFFDQPIMSLTCEYSICINICVRYGVAKCYTTIPFLFVLVMRDQAWSVPFEKGQSKIDHAASQHSTLAQLAKSEVWGFDLTKPIDVGLTLTVGVRPGPTGSDPGDVDEGYSEYRAIPLGRISKVVAVAGKPMVVEVYVMRFGKGTVNNSSFSVKLDISNFRYSSCKTHINILEGNSLCV